MRRERNNNTISRRDFLNGTALVIAGGLMPLTQLRATPDRYYPPALTGLRGSHPGSFESAHQVGREGESFDVSGLAVEEQFDLVVVGGGISGLAAAWFYRETHGPSSRILILENHDDFGGHAKRNEFHVGGRLLIGYGGTESLQSPKVTFSATANRLLGALGVNYDRFNAAFDLKLYPSLNLAEGVFFDRETFGADRLVVGTPIVTGADSSATIGKRRPFEEVIAEFPLSDDAKARLIAFYKEPKDYLAGKSKAEKIAYLKKISYREYLRKDAGLGDEAIKYFEGGTKDFMGMGPDILPAFDALATEYPGFAGLGLKDQEETDYYAPYIYHFPDGNASVARLLVRSLVPAVASGHTMDDVVLADFAYTKLDLPGTPIRMRLNSTAVSVANSTGGAVDIGYVRSGALHRVQAKHCVLACYNMIIPHIMPELPDVQKKALALSVKMPLLYANVALRNWQAFMKLGVDRIHSPSGYFATTKLDYPVSLGRYHNPREPNEPILVHMVNVPLTPNQGLSNIEQFRLGRYKLLATPFEEFEKQITNQLDRMLGPGGFRSDRDIAAITVNRWPHGYSYVTNTLFDPQTPGPKPYEIARQRCRNVTIANADAGWNAYTHEAIDQAWRAVNELKST